MAAFTVGNMATWIVGSATDDSSLEPQPAQKKATEALTRMKSGIVLHARFAEDLPCMIIFTSLQPWGTRAIGWINDDGLRCGRGRRVLARVDLHRLATGQIVRLVNRMRLSMQTTQDLGCGRAHARLALLRVDRPAFVNHGMQSR